MIQYHTHFFCAAMPLILFRQEKESCVHVQQSESYVYFTKLGKFLLKHLLLNLYVFGPKYTEYYVPRCYFMVSFAWDCHLSPLASVVKVCFLCLPAELRFLVLFLLWEIFFVFVFINRPCYNDMSSIT